MKFSGHVATHIVNEVKGVNRVVYDMTSKSQAADREIADFMTVPRSRPG